MENNAIYFPTYSMELADPSLEMYCSVLKETDKARHICNILHSAYVSTFI